MAQDYEENPPNAVYSKIRQTGSLKKIRQFHFCVAELGSPLASHYSRVPAPAVRGRHLLNSGQDEHGHSADDSAL